MAGSRLSSVSAASFELSGRAVALRCRTFWMNSDTDPGAAVAIACAFPGTD
jgi:hypothetical protein